MKNLFKFIVASVLALLARAVVLRYHPRIVMVTGSVGKTSTKDAVASVLASRFLVRKSEKSFNSEFGVPFTILGADNPWGNPLAWFLLLKRSLALLALPNQYPNLLVLEVGADRPGDLARILRIVTPNAVVVTQLPEVPVHVEAYASPDAVREEEFSPAFALPAGAPLIISADDSYALDAARRSPAQVITFGTAEHSTVRVSHIGFHTSEKEVKGMRAEVRVGGEHAGFVVNGSVGAVQVQPVAAALAAAVAFDIPLTDAVAALEGYEPPPGRGRVLKGKHGSIIIDDSYNSSPIAVEHALETLKAFPHATRRIAVLGDMLELGRYSVSEHQRLGLLARDSADLLATVGIRARAFASIEGKAETVLFDNSHSAAKALVDLVQSGDVILVKGSQSVRTERIVKALLADPKDVELLVRQEKKWQERG